MIVHEIKTINTIFNVRFFLYIIYSKIKSFYGGITKYIMQYLDMAWENKYIFTFSRNLEVMSKNLNKDFRTWMAITNFLA